MTFLMLSLITQCTLILQNGVTHSHAHTAQQAASPHIHYDHGATHSHHDCASHDHGHEFAHDHESGPIESPANDHSSHDSGTFYLVNQHTVVEYRLVLNDIISNTQLYVIWCFLPIDFWKPAVLDSDRFKVDSSPPLNLHGPLYLQHQAMLI
jgi:hypothetical protein